MPTSNDLRERARQTMTEARALLEQHDGGEELPADVGARVDDLIARGREEWQAYESALAERERHAALSELEQAWHDGERGARQRLRDPNAGSGEAGERQIGERQRPALYRKAFETYVHHGERAVLALGGAYVKALTAGTDSEGGHLVPVDWQAQILRAAGARAGLRRHVTAIPTSRDAVEWPTIEGGGDIHASAVRRTWVDEQPAEGAAESEPTFGAIRIPVHTAMLTTKASRNLVEDSAVPFTDILAGLFGDEVRLSDEEAFLAGDGVGKPLGLLNTAGVPSVNSGHASKVTADGLLDLFYGLPAQYRDAAVFVTNSATEDAVRKLKDGNNQYLWVGGFAATPETLLGRPVVSSEFMPAVKANATPIAFGDFSRYVVVDRVGFAVQRIDGDQQLAEKNQVGFVGRQRVGGRVTQPRGFRLQKISA